MISSCIIHYHKIKTATLHQLMAVKVAVKFKIR